MARTFIIANPNAGGGEVSIADLQELIAARPSYELHLTAAAGDGRKLAAQAAKEGFETVVAAGGDGTLNEVVNGLADAFGKIRLGLLPLGTGNDFGRTIQLAPDLETALEALDAGHTRLCDVARIHNGGEHYFINVSAGGFSGEMNERLTTDVKRVWGPLAYLRAAVECISELSPYAVKLTLDGDRTVEIDALNLAVANARHVAAGVPIAPEAEIGDGLLDVVVIKNCSLAALALLAPKVLAAQHLGGETEEIAFYRARAIEIEAVPEMSFNADGELLDGQPTRFEVLPGALEVIVPETASNGALAERAAEERQAVAA